MAAPSSRAAAWLMALTALIWSSGGLGIKIIDLSPLAITGGRSLLAAVTLALILRGRLGRPRSWACVAAALAYAFTLSSHVWATKLTTAANAILLAYTAPVYVALLAPWLLGEPTQRRDWVFIAAALGGMVLFFMDKLTPGGWSGNLIAMGTGLSYAIFTLCMRAQREASPLDAIFWGHVLTALVGLPALLDDWPDGYSWLGLAYLGVVQQGVSLLIYVWAIRRLGALPAILILTLEPVLNPVWVALGHGELPGPWALLGGALVVGSVTLRGLLAGWRAGVISGTQPTAPSH